MWLWLCPGQIRRYKAQMEDIGKAWEARLAEARKEIEVGAMCHEAN